MSARFFVRALVAAEWNRLAEILLLDLTKEIDLAQIKGTTTGQIELITPSLGRFADNRRPIVTVTIKAAE